MVPTQRPASYRSSSHLLFPPTGQPTESTAKTMPKLLKGRSQSTITSHSTSSLPSASYRSEINIGLTSLTTSTSSASVEVANPDGTLPHETLRVGTGGVSGVGEKSAQPPPSAFSRSLKRTFSFGRRKERQRSGSAERPPVSHQDGAGRRLKADSPSLLPGPSKECA